MISQRQGTASIQAVTWWAVHMHWVPIAKFWWQGELQRWLL